MQRFLPFLASLLLYILASEYQSSINPGQKILPTVDKIGSSILSYAIEADKGLGAPPLVIDTYLSVRRVVVGTLAAGVVGLFCGLNLALSKSWRLTLGSFVTVLSVVPPITILPILFLTIGIGEIAIVALVFMGTVLPITRDIALAVESLPSQYRVKALTLGATSRDVIFDIFVPLTVPRLINSIRVNLGAAWIFVIVAESLVAEAGLGYRIFLVRRFLAMDVILPYVIWIAILGHSMDLLLAKILRWRYRWYESGA